MMASLRSVDRNLKFGLVQSPIRRPSPPYVILVDGGLSPPSGRASRRPPEFDFLELDCVETHALLATSRDGMSETIGMTWGMHDRRG